MKLLHKHITEDIEMIHKGGLNLDRSLCPQITQENIPGFVHFAAENGISVSHKKIPVNEIKPVQGHYDTKKVDKLCKTPKLLANGNAIVSKDHYILDGHHRWLALLKNSSFNKINAYVFDTTIADLIALANRYPKTFHKDV